MLIYPSEILSFMTSECASTSGLSTSKPHLAVHCAIKSHIQKVHHLSLDVAFLFLKCRLFFGESSQIALAAFAILLLKVIMAPPKFFCKKEIDLRL